LGSRYHPTERDVFVFNTALSLFTVYFANDKELMRSYDTFKAEQSDANLVSLLRTAAKKANLDLFDTQIKEVMSVSPQFLPYAVSLSVGTDGDSTDSSDAIPKRDSS